MKHWIVGLLLLLASPVWAANKYVRPGAAGTATGADWTNAYVDLPATLTRGDTYYLADGTYATYTFDDAVSGTSVITVKKATIADHGTETGWVSTYGDGTASFGQLSIETSYYAIDGNTDVVGSYGIHVSWPTGGVAIFRVGVGIDTTVSNITVRDVSVNGAGIGLQRGIQIDGATDLLFSNVQSWNLDNDGVLLNVSVTNSIFEYMYIHTRNDAGLVPTTHADAIEVQKATSNITWRYSRFNWAGQQVFWGGLTPTGHGTWYIYGNRFYAAPDYAGSKGMHGHSTNPLIGPIYVYNNTFANIELAHDFQTGVTGEVKNNIYYDVLVPPSFGNTTHNYNWFKTGQSTAGEANAQTGGDPFVSEGTGDYRLSAATTAGATLGSPYNVDIDAVTRGADGTWDRGAYEYSGTTTYTLTVTNVGTGTVTGTGISCPGDCTESYTNGTGVTLTAVAGAGYTFTGWSGNCSGMLTCVVSMISDRAVTATFVINVPAAPTVLGVGG